MEAPQDKRAFQGEWRGGGGGGGGVRIPPRLANFKTQCITWCVTDYSHKIIMLSGEKIKKGKKSHVWRFLFVLLCFFRSAVYIVWRSINKITHTKSTDHRLTADIYRLVDVKGLMRVKQVTKQRVKTKLVLYRAQQKEPCVSVRCKIMCLLLHELSPLLYYCSWLTTTP